MTPSVTSAYGHDRAAACHGVTGRDQPARRKAKEPAAIFIVVKWTIRPERSGEWLDLVADFTAGTRGEPGNLFFDWHRSVDNPDQFVLVEGFRDGDAGGAHVQSAHFKTAQQALPPHLVETPRIVNFEVPGDDWARLGELAVD